MDKMPPSAGKTVAIAGVSATQLVTLLLWVSPKFGITDMNDAVAASIVGIAMAFAGAIMHTLQRKEEKRNAQADAETNGVTGGPDVQPPKP